MRLGRSEMRLGRSTTRSKVDVMKARATKDVAIKMLASSSQLMKDTAEEMKMAHTIESTSQPSKESSRSTERSKMLEQIARLQAEQVRLQTEMRAELDVDGPLADGAPSILVQWWPKPVITPGAQSWATDRLLRWPEVRG